MSVKLVLDTYVMEENFFSGTVLIGISSPTTVYRLCWLLNEHLGTNFVREPEGNHIILQSPKSDKQYFFPIYKYEMPMQGSKYCVYKLKSEEGLLLPELKQLDYLWLIESVTAEEEANLMVQHIKTLPDIDHAQILSPDKLKHLNHLLV